MNSEPALNLDLLRLLSDAGGEAVGMGDLLLALGIPRETLYAELDVLRDAGYVIGKSHPYGSTAYQLLEVPDRLIRFEIERHLDTRWLGRPFRILQSCTSTNDVAREAAGEGAGHGTVVLAEEQTAGRGRGGNTWHSPPGAGLYLSIVLRPGAAVPGGAAVQIATAVGVAHAVMRRTGKAVRIRWPNDVVVGEKKVAGMLAEAESAGTPDAVYVVGIGLNVRQSVADFPGALAKQATSLSIVAEKELNRLHVLPTLLASLEQWYDHLLAGRQEEIEAAWRPLSQLLDRSVTLTCGDESRTGRVTGLSLTRGIRLETSDREEWIPAEHARQVRLLDVTGE